MAQIDTADLISITEANKLGVSGLVREAETGHDKIVLRNNKPVAAVVSIDRLDEFERLREDFLDISLIAARMVTDTAERHSLDDIFTQFGFTRDELRELPD